MYWYMYMIAMQYCVCMKILHESTIIDMILARIRFFLLPIS